MSKKYLIHKGYQGWGDRLQSLSYCLDYAKKTGRYLYIDWMDPLWGQGDPSKNFYQYFGLQGINQIESIDEIPADVTVYPSYWNKKLNEKSGIWIHSKKTILEVKLDLDRPEDVVVVTAIGYRQWSAETITAHLTFQPPLITEVKRKLALIPNKDFYGVHLRGTDRTTSIQTCINIGQQLFELSKLTSFPIVLISDDSHLVSEWLKIMPDTILLTETTHKLNGLGLGTHMIPPEKLEKYGITKEGLILELLSDFFVYSLAKFHFTNNAASTFSQMAKLLGTFDPSRIILEKAFIEK
jgi:hypothetical protein